ncbi:VWA domain-containing protein [Prosthecobacter sp.]|uniref:vWA domain-containing protein n=1 Tax=Prosthecobacter sp. TaxID=1965333 RepID=UPI002489D6AA|nr:VWA domain-containing protein [Prosthecobacter sp.]MDI1313991.1 VWA domain-containing protein [Prosthecobacter sp.]
MAHHASDDFSFLPTVDSTDEEDVVKETPWKSQPAPAPPEAIEQEYEPVAESFPAEEAGYEELVPEEAAYEEQQTAEDRLEFESEAAPPVEEARADEVFQKVAEAPLVKAQPPTILPKLEEIAPPAQESPEAAGLSVAPEEKPSAQPAATVLPRSDDASTDKPNTDADPEAGKNPKPFIAPKFAPEEPLDPEQAKKLRWQKLADKIGLRTLGMSFGVHFFLLLIAAFIGVSQVMDQQVDFLPGGSSPQSQAAAAALTHKIQNKKNPWLKAKPPMRKITVQTLSSNIVMPEMSAMDMMDFSKINDRMDLSKAPSMASSQPAGMGMGGAGGGFGAGIGTGGKFNFLGQTAFGRRVVFVVDFSSSMSQRLKGENQGMTRFELMKKELIKAVKQIPFGTAYQILFFSDFAWPHNQVDSRNEGELEKYFWEIKSEVYKEAKIPAFKYIQATQFTLQDSAEVIQRSDNSRIYTNWGSGLLMALSANPKPDVIYFMTDGESKDENGWIDIVTAENKRKLPMTVIHTSVMAQTDAAPEMNSLAKRNNGNFTVVTDDGRVIKGEDFLK